MRSVAAQERGSGFQLATASRAPAQCASVGRMDGPSQVGPEGASSSAGFAAGVTGAGEDGGSKTRSEKGEEARRQAHDAMEFDEEESARKWGGGQPFWGPDYTAGDRRASTFYNGEYAPSHQSWRDDKPVRASRTLPRPYDERDTTLARVQRTDNASRLAPPCVVSIRRMAPQRVAARLPAATEGAFMSDMVGASAIEESSSPSSMPAGSPMSTGDTRRTTVWLAPLPTDVDHAELVQLFGGHSVLEYSLHAAKTGDEREAYAVEVRLDSVAAAEKLAGEVLEGRVAVRGWAIKLFEVEDVDMEEGEGRDGQAHGVLAHVGEEEEMEECDDRCDPRPGPLLYRDNVTPLSPSSSLGGSLPARLAATHLSPSQPATSTPPSPSPSPPSASRPRSTTQRLGARHRIHPTRLVSPYPRAPSPHDDQYAAREAEIAREMNAEVKEALEERAERERWERWFARWEAAEVVDLTVDNVGAGMEVDA